MTNNSLSVPRVAVVGGGHLGRIHAKLLAANPGCELVCVADPDVNSRQLVSTQLGLATVADYKNLAGLVDGAVIATPTFLHHEVGMWCLNNNIHCLIEKPIATNSSEAKQLVDLANVEGLTLQIGHVERFNPVWTAAKESIDSHSIRYIEATREGCYTGRSTDIGIVLDLMIHDIDLILSIVPSSVERVHAFGWTVLGQHEDMAVAQLVFRNGTMAQLRASRVSESMNRCMQICADTELTKIDFAQGTVTRTRPHDDVLEGKRLADKLPPLERAKVKDVLFSDWLHKTENKPASANAIAMEHDEWLRAIRYGHDVTVPGIMGAQALHTAELIIDALSLGRSNSFVIPAANRFAA
ncbi:MAG: Gfo/Idh/MocA family oxidoreductase [Pirellula sp.]|nr:Gfo/Idh/MocA family oxidoreductase [Pirellula sp.]